MVINQWIFLPKTYYKNAVFIYFFFKLYISLDECKDNEEWCKYEPNCAKEDVQTKCPKFCKICKGITTFKSLKNDIM